MPAPPLLATLHRCHPERRALQGPGEASGGGRCGQGARLGARPQEQEHAGLSRSEPSRKRGLSPGHGRPLFQVRDEQACPASLRHSPEQDLSWASTLPRPAPSLPPCLARGSDPSPSRVAWPARCPTAVRRGPGPGPLPLSRLSQL